jgi:hypothetical protein
MALGGRLGVLPGGQRPDLRAPQLPCPVDEPRRIGLDPRGLPLSLFTVSAFSIAHAFYIMTADCCDPDHRKPEIFELDPEYYGVDIEIVLFNVGEKAGWIVDRLWDAFCEYRNDIWPYEIVPATTFHIKVENGRQRQGRA